MTDEAQMELMKIFDIILQSDISIIKECKSLNKVWVDCLHCDAGTTNMPETVKWILLMLWVRIPQNASKNQTDTKCKFNNLIIYKE